MTLASSVGISIGDILQQTPSSTQFTAQVTGNNTATGVIDVTTTTGFTTGSAQDYHSIVTVLQYTPITCGFPQNMKKFSNWKFAFTNANFNSIQITFTSDLYSIPETATLTPLNSGGWGAESGGWGSVPWGVSAAAQQFLACNPSLNTSYARWVTIKMALTQAFTSLAFDGITSSFDVVSNRGR